MPYRITSRGHSKIKDRRNDLRLRRSTSQVSSTHDSNAGIIPRYVAANGEARLLHYSSGRRRVRGSAQDQPATDTE